MQKLPSLRPTAPVIVRGESWIVVDVERHTRCSIVTLRGRDHDNFGTTTRVIAPFDRIAPVTRSDTPLATTRRATLVAAARALVRVQPWDQCWSATTARIDWLAWQMAPALAAVRGTMRILLADSVGLGKTIQAALILAELRARRFIARALILTPASIRDQWAAELSNRFDIEAVIYDHDTLTRLSASLPPAVNPWTTADVIVSSIDLVKRPEIRAALEGVPFDLLIVDEAHHVAPGTDRGAVVSGLAARTPWVVLATATPHSGDERAFAFLEQLGAHGNGPLSVFRRAPAQVGRIRPRRVRLHAVNAHAQERDLLAATLAYAREMWQGRGVHDRHVRLVAAVIAKRAASSRRALLRTIERRRDLLAREKKPATIQPLLPWQEGDEGDAQTADASLGCVGLDDASRELEVLDRLLALTLEAREESKAAVLERLLQRTSEPAVVFSEYRDTVEQYEETLRRFATVSVLHGGLTTSVRREALQSFVAGRTSVLLATDAAGEGLNLQSRCRLVINIELPWNPLRLEQRIGRVDRLGQQRRVHAIHLFHRGSFEDHVLAKLDRRTRKATLHDQFPCEEAIAAAILGKRRRLPAVTTSRLTSDARIAGDGSDRVQLSSLVIRAGCSTLLPDRPMMCAIEPENDSEQLIAVFECDLRDGRERIVERNVLALKIALSPANDCCQVTSLPAIVASAPVRATVLQQCDDRVETVRPDLSKASRSISQRLRNILRHLEEQCRSNTYQRSLFDRRAERRAHGRRAALLHCRERIERQLEGSEALATVNRDHAPRLIAVWPIPR